MPTSHHDVLQDLVLDLDLELMRRRDPAAPPWFLRLPSGIYRRIRGLVGVHGGWSRARRPLESCRVATIQSKQPIPAFKARQRHRRWP